MPPLLPAGLPEKVLFVTVSAPLLMILPPPSTLVDAKPCWIVRALIATVIPVVTVKTDDALLPSTAIVAPVPSIVRFLSRVSVPAVSRIGDALGQFSPAWKRIVSPGMAAVIAARSDPSPLSLQLMTREARRAPTRRGARVEATGARAIPVTKRV